ncbi:hypothetical protein PIB30_031959 [Stylosanthes scabra]|uniref:Uncharacterized protein n=1 Tax=Stylosanthes scabra TaxID=79078 RepID=A0ABU6SBV2_9FABA|nr:hypothetical protein [Stylosanthes scabra]
MQLQLVTTKVDKAIAAKDAEPTPAKDVEPAPPPAQDNVATEIPTTQDSQSALAVITDKVKRRPLKLQVKKGRPTRAVYPPPAASSTPPLSAETISRASSATAKKTASLSKFMPLRGSSVQGRKIIEDDCCEVFCVFGGFIIFFVLWHMNHLA